MHSKNASMQPRGQKCTHWSIRDLRLARVAKSWAAKAKARAKAAANQEHTAQDKGEGEADEAGDDADDDFAGSGDAQSELSDGSDEDNMSPRSHDGGKVASKKRKRPSQPTSKVPQWTRAHSSMAVGLFVGEEKELLRRVRAGENVTVEALDRSDRRGPAVQAKAVGKAKAQPKAHELAQPTASLPPAAPRAHVEGTRARLARLRACAQPSAMGMHM